MSRWIAGMVDPRARAHGGRLPCALEPYAARVIEQGALRVSCTGPPPAASAPLCLLGGDIDNAEAIRAELSAPPACSAEELLAAGYRRWGERLPAHLRGDFVLLIWDGLRQEGLLARDQLGVRCVYLYDRDGALHFADEVRHLLALLPRRPAPDPAGVAHWVAARARPGGGTLYAGVRRLGPGCLLRLDGRGGAEERRYWTPTYKGRAALEESRSPGQPLEHAAAVRDAIDVAVQRRLAPSGGTGVLLSGGLDSATVAAMAAEHAPLRVGSYSGVFPEHPRVDESMLIRLLRRALMLAGTVAEVRAGGLLASALSYQRAWELPLLSWGDFWTLPLLRSAADDGVEIMLGGDGGDELFDTRAYLIADRLRGGHPRAALALAGELPGAGEHPPRLALVRAALRFALPGAIPYRLHAFVRRPAARAGLPAWLSRVSARQLARVEDPLAWKRLDGPRWWAHAAHSLAWQIEQTGIFELHRHRAAMAGLQARHPLLDLDLVELVLGQDPLRSFDAHRSRPMLRAATAGLLPDAVRLRAAKALFESLVLDTLVGPDRVAVRRLLCDRTAELGAYVDLPAVRRLLLEGGSASGSPVQWVQHVWRLSTAECWLRSQSETDHEKLLAALRPSRPQVVLFSDLTADQPDLHSLQA